MKTATAGWIAAILVSLLGCEPEGIYEDTVLTGGIVTLKNGISIHRLDEDSLYYFDASIDEPKLSKLFSPADGESIIWTKAGPEATAPTQLFVLTAPTDPRNTSIEERLYRVTTDQKAPTVYKIGSQFDQMVFSPDERFAVLYHGEADTSSGLYNPNEAALVDLSDRPSDTNPLVLSVSMDGNSIDMVTFVSGLHIGGTERDLAVFVAGSIVRILDLNDPENIWAKVPLLADDTSSGFVASQVISLDETADCDNAACEAKLFIRSATTQDIYYITLGRNGDGFEDVQTKQLEAGGYPTAMEIIYDGDTVLLAVLSASSGLGKLNIVDIDTSASFSLSFTGNFTQMRQVVDEENGDKLVLWGNYTGAVYFVTVTDITQEKGRNAEPFTVDGSISSYRELDDNRLLLLPSNGNLVLLDLNTEEASMLSSNVDYDWSAAQIAEEIFYAIPVSGDRVDYYNLETGRPDSLLLDDSCVSLHLATGRNTGLIWHSTSTGRVTLFQLSSPTRASSLVVDGLWLKGILDEKGAE